MAYEVLIQSQQGYDLSIDYWSIGCILFEMVSGFPPFTGPTNNDVWVNIFHWKKVLERPTYDGVDVEFNMSDQVWDLINRFICDASIRLVDLIKIERHEFFRRPIDESRSLDFSRMRDGSYIVPHVPKLKSDIDTSYFDDFDNLDMEVYKDIIVGDREQGGSSEMCKGGPASGFVGFTYTQK